MKEEIVQYEEKFLQAFRTLNVEGLDGLIHDRLIYNSPTGEVLNKEMDLGVIKSGYVIVERLDCVEREIQFFDDTAIVSTVVYLKGSIMNHPIDGKTRFLRTWKKIEDGWKIIGAASISLG